LGESAGPSEPGAKKTKAAKTRSGAKKKPARGKK
jgi:hypothetical protein